MEGVSHGLTRLHVQKARWAPELHGRKLELTWTAGEGYEVKEDRNYLGEIEELLSDLYPRTLDEVSNPRHADQPGIGADKNKVKALLDEALTLEKIYKLTPAEAKAAGRERTAGNGIYYCSVLPKTEHTEQHGF